MSDELVETLRTKLSDEQLVELTATIAWENFRARFNRGFDVGEQGFSGAAYCVLPEQHAREHAPDRSTEPGVPPARLSRE